MENKDKEKRPNPFWEEEDDRDRYVNVFSGVTGAFVGVWDKEKRQWVSREYDKDLPETNTITLFT